MSEIDSLAESLRALKLELLAPKADTQKAQISVDALTKQLDMLQLRVRGKEEFAQAMQEQTQQLLNYL